MLASTAPPLIQRCRQPQQRRMPGQIVQGGSGTGKGSESALGRAGDDPGVNPGYCLQMRQESEFLQCGPADPDWWEVSDLLRSAVCQLRQLLCLREQLEVQLIVSVSTAETAEKCLETWEGGKGILRAFLHLLPWGRLQNGDVQLLRE